MKNIISKQERDKIFSLFIQKYKIKFNEIEKKLKIRSNHLNYHLKKMMDNNILEKEGEFYKLTKEAEKMIPFYMHITEKEQGPLSIITAAIINQNKICLLKRKKRPYQNYWGLIGGKLKLEESIKQTALREVEEETGLKCKFEKISSILHERVKDSGKIKHSFIIFLCKLATNENKLKETNEGELKWFLLSKLPSKLIPSDRKMIKELLDNNFSCRDVIIEDKKGKLLNMKFKEGGSM